MNSFLSILLGTCATILLTFYDSGANNKSPFGSKRWYVYANTIHPALDFNMDGKKDTDLIQLMEPCERDDSAFYAPDGTVTTFRGRLRCDEEEEDEEETGTWRYDPKTKILTLHSYDSRKAIVATVVRSTASEIELLSEHRSSAGIHTIRTIFRAR
jgi:hypothetical protein